MREPLRRAREATLRELFARITFNILTGNTDDHARNHAAFWDGRELTPDTRLRHLPAAPGRRRSRRRVMAIGEDG